LINYSKQYLIFDKKKILNILKILVNKKKREEKENEGKILEKMKKKIKENIYYKYEGLCKLQIYK
jgi:hypothetical protein